MKVLHLLQSGFFSGAENVVCQIIDMFSSNKELEMFYVSRDGSIRKTIEDKKIIFYGLNKFNVVNVKKAINDINPDIIHAHDISASVIASICAPKNCRIISHVHVNNTNMSKISFKTLIYLYASRRFKKIFWVSQSCFDNFVFRNKLLDKSQVLYNVMDKKSIIAKKELDKNHYVYDVAYVGRITYQKNPEKLIEVINFLHNFNKNVKVAIVGTGDKFNDLIKLVKQYNLESVVDILGFMDNPLKLLSNSKVMVMTSRYEGLPMTVLEAMALGVPVVSTPVDGLRDVIINEKNGYLLHDSKKIAEKLNEIVINSNLRERMSKSAVEIFDKKMDLVSYKNSIKHAYLD